MLQAGDRAPDIQVQTDSGEDFRLSDMKGKRAVLYFYLKSAALIGASYSERSLSLSVPSFACSARASIRS